jgi:hypothetical protein
MPTNSSISPTIRIRLRGSRSCMRCWNVAGIRLPSKTPCLKSQRRRRLVDRSLREGKLVPWEYEPPSGASDSYMRNHLDLNDLERRRRFPR